MTQERIELIPAIDIIGGRLVRLTKGDYGSEKIYNEHPLEVAKQFEDYGFRRLHLVDLDGAKSRHIVNSSVLEDIATHTRLTIDFGGGIKTEEDLREAFDAGAAMVTVGSLSATDPDTFLSWTDKYGADRFIIGADVDNEEIRINGWKEGNGVRLFPFLERYHSHGLRHVLCTDIAHDGTLQGPAISLYQKIMARFPDCHLIASGGVGSEADIAALENAHIPAVVFGKAIYEGRIDLRLLSRKYLQ